MTQNLTADHDTWASQYQELAAAMQDLTTEIEPGIWIIDPAAPESLVETYHAMIRIGYAHGWMA